MSMPRCRRRKPFLLYHWAPLHRRADIEKHGLVIGSKTVIHTPGWTPTYLCFSDSPSLAWALSGQTSAVAGWWDLWMVWSNELPGGVLWREDYQGKTPAEFRTKQSVPKGKLWYVATRNHQPKKKK